MKYLYEIIEPTENRNFKADIRCYMCLKAGRYVAKKSSFGKNVFNGNSLYKMNCDKYPALCFNCVNYLESTNAFFAIGGAATL